MTRTQPADFEAFATGSRSKREALERLERLATFMDTAIVIPGTGIRFGADSIIGLFPGIGDTLTTALSAYLVYQAHRLGIPRTLLMRMIGNVAIDGFVGAVPVAGDVFDVLWKANRRNMRLLREHLHREGHL